MIHNVSDFTHREGVEVIGDTTFVNGSPQIKCGNCNRLISLIEQGSTVATPGRIIKGIGRGKQEHPIERRLNPYKILIGTKVPEDDYLLAPDLHTDGRKTLSVKTTWLHRVSSVIGCFDCWREQQKQIAIKRASDHPDGIVFFWRRSLEDHTRFIAADLHDFAVRVGWCVDYLPPDGSSVSIPLSRRDQRNLLKLHQIAQEQSERLRKNRKKPHHTRLEPVEPVIRIKSKDRHHSNLARQVRERT